MPKNGLARLLAVWAGLDLAACGGGGGSGVASTPPPPSTPSTQTCPDGSVIPVTSTCPPPPPAHSPAIFPNVTTDTNFAVLGGASDISTFHVLEDGFAVRYEAASQNYIISIPSSSLGSIVTGAFIQESTYWDDGHLTVYKTSAANPNAKFTYTTFATYLYFDSFDREDFSVFAFGSATPASGVPVTGTAQYNADVVGFTLDNPGSGVGGSATLQFDFGAGTLGGHFDPTIGNTSLGRYDFFNTVFGVGSTTFSGQFSNAGSNTGGAFDGVFTGPAAQELMARWGASYLRPDTQQPSEMFGVWVGKK